MNLTKQKKHISSTIKKTMKRRTILIISLLLLFGVKAGQTHPHAFLDCELTVVFNDQGLAGFQQRWILDEMFTSFLLEEFDTDYNLKFNSDEIQAIKQGAFDNLCEYGYFTHILIEGQKFTIKEVTSFSVEMNEEEKAIYSFFVPCPVQTADNPRQVLISVFDDTYYTDVLLLRKAIAYKNPEQFTIESRVKEIPELIYYFDQIIPEGLFFTFAPKSP